MSCLRETWLYATPEAMSHAVLRLKCISLKKQTRSQTCLAVHAVGRSTAALLFSLFSERLDEGGKVASHPMQFYDPHGAAAAAGSLDEVACLTGTGASLAWK